MSTILKWCLLSAVCLSAILLVRGRAHTTCAIVTGPLALGNYTITISSSRQMAIPRLAADEPDQAEILQYVATPQPGRTYLLCQISMHNNTSQELSFSTFRAIDEKGQQLGSVAERLRPWREVKRMKSPLAPRATATGEVVFEVVPGTRLARIEAISTWCQCE